MIIQSAMVSRFCVRPTSKRRLLKIVQKTMKHDPFDDMQESIQTLHPPCTHVLHRSLKRSVKHELGLAPSFPPMRVLEVKRSRALSLVCEVGPYMQVPQSLSHSTRMAKASRCLHKLTTEKVENFAIIFIAWNNSFVKRFDLELGIKCPDLVY